MTTPQPGIFAIGTRSHHHLQLDVLPGASGADLLSALGKIRAAATTVDGVNVVVGLSAALCERVAPAWLPHDLGPFEPIVGGGVVMPADQHDLWLWLHGAGPDALFDTARTAVAALDGLAVVATEQQCFAYQDSRDLTGFEDGTENPPIDEAPVVATVPAGQPGAGGSVVLLQRWVHDLDGFARLDADEQNQVIGRDKVSNEELPDDARSPRSHVSRVAIDDDEGDELEVFRRSVAFGGVLEHGLMFVAFSADVTRLDQMLRRMVGEGDGVTDALADFSASSGGAWYVAPPVEAFVTVDANISD